jgi:hypothetical protein
MARAGYTHGSSLPLVQDGGLAIRYLPHLESTVVLYVPESSLTDERADLGWAARAIARRKRLTQLRISGNEPTICRAHLISVLSPDPERLSLHS